MSATTAAVNPTVPPAAAPARSGGAPQSTDDSRFDHHLDAARQQRGEARQQPTHDDGDHKPQAKTPSTTETAAAHRPASDTAGKDETPDAAALAAAMLALIGQAAPAKPLAMATAVTHAAVKTLTAATATTAATAATAAAQAPTAPALLTGAAGAPSAGPAFELDARSLAPMLAKPAEQKDAPLDASQLASVSTALATPGPAASVVPAHNLSIGSPVGTPAFAQELGQHVAWLGGQDVKQARIRLHPEELGTLDIKVNINHDRVDVSFAVQHPGVVHVVQQTLPQLDALLAHHGLSLGQADVGQRQHQGDGGRAGEGTGAIGEIEAEQGILASTPLAALGMLDTFA